jgi:hypothetical protein
MAGARYEDAHYCNKLCWARDFSPRFQVALDRAAGDDPGPFPEPHPPSAETESTSGGSDLESSGKDDGEWAVIGLGLAVMAAASVLIGFICARAGYPLFALMGPSVFPSGAWLCGMATGLGFWLTLRRLHRRATLRSSLAAGLAGLAAYLLIAAVAWSSLEDHGKNVRDSTSFIEFLQWRLRLGPRGQIRRDAAFVVSKGGYDALAANLLGFVFGIGTASGLTLAGPYCSRCRRYLMKAGEQTRRSSDPEASAAALHPIIAAVRAGRVQEALDLHAALDAADRKGVLTTTISVVACPSCGVHTATLVGSYPKNHDVAVAKGFGYEGKTDRQVVIRG